MKYELNLEDKYGDSLIKEFKEIPEGVTYLDGGVSFLHRKNSDDLAKAFSCIPKSVKHINLRYSMICARTIK